MPRSMTGFGVAEGPVSGGQLHIEIRTVNHRHFSAQLKVPRSLQEHESDMRDALRGEIDRGHVTVSARWVEEPVLDAAVSVNVDRARQILAAVTELKRELALDGEVDLAFIARQPDVLIERREAPPVEWPEVCRVLANALSGVTSMREREGAVLVTEVGRRLDAIEQGVAQVADQAPLRMVAERDRLRDAVEQLIEGRVVDDDRLAHELAILADKLDVTEEIVRLRAHIDAAREALTSKVPVGRQLGFLAQEVLREMNTIGSKANDAGVAQAVIAMKGELEKFREQVENIE